ncbi:MAG: hypothetical protein ABIJ34_05015 [archaeon]
MAISYKQQCMRCKKNFVLTNYKERYPICYDCQKSELDKPIDNKEMKELFDIPEDFYKKNGFLRNIKLNYLRYHNLTEKQIAAFKKNVETLKNDANSKH